MRIDMKKLPIILITLLVTTGVYFTVSQKNKTDNPNNDQQESNQITYSNQQIVSIIEANWQNIQSSITIKPSFHNQQANSNAIWRGPLAVQFIAENTVLVQIEDDDNSHIVIFKFVDGHFIFLEIIESQADFTLDDWQDLENKYNGGGFPIQTYTKEVVRNGEIVSFDNLTLIPENIFVRNYWENN